MPTCDRLCRSPQRKRLTVFATAASVRAGEVFPESGRRRHRRVTDPRRRERRVTRDVIPTRCKQTRRLAVAASLRVFRIYEGLFFVSIDAIGRRSAKAQSAGVSTSRCASAGSPDRKTLRRIRFFRIFTIVSLCAPGKRPTSSRVIFLIAARRLRLSVLPYNKIPDRSGERRPRCNFRVRIRGKTRFRR